MSGNIIHTYTVHLTSIWLVYVIGIIWISAKRSHKTPGYIKLQFENSSEVWSRPLDAANVENKTSML